MTALLEILKADSESKFCWSGRIVLPDGPRPPIAEPMLLVRNDHASIVMAAGALTQRAMLNLALLVCAEARCPTTRLVYLLLAVPCGRLGCLATAGKYLREAGRHAAIVAYLQECAFGPALWLANQCGLVFSHPSTAIGWTESVSEEGEFDCDATLGMVHDLAVLNPRVPFATWARLVQSSITGEQAEAMGIVGGLRRSVFDLSGIDAGGGQAP